jgi:hypothetical protein
VGFTVLLLLCNKRCVERWSLCSPPNGVKQETLGELCYGVHSPQKVSYHDSLDAISPKTFFSINASKRNAFCVFPKIYSNVYWANTVCDLTSCGWLKEYSFVTIYVSVTPKYLIPLGVLSICWSVVNLNVQPECGLIHTVAPTFWSELFPKPFQLTWFDVPWVGWQSRAGWSNSGVEDQGAVTTRRETNLPFRNPNASLGTKSNDHLRVTSLALVCVGIHPEIDHIKTDNAWTRKLVCRTL